MLLLLVEDGFRTDEVLLLFTSDARCLLVVAQRGHIGRLLVFGGGALGHDAEGDLPALAGGVGLKKPGVQFTLHQLFKVLMADLLLSTHV